jgi:phospholipase/carboxylesterase
MAIDWTADNPTYAAAAQALATNSVNDSSADRLQLGPSTARQRLVLLHGWGADADDLLDLGELLVGPETSVVALRAPEPHPYGSGRQWYGLEPIDWSALPAAREALRQRLQALAESVALEHTVLLGFSQGGAMALDVGSRLPLAGIVSCSGYPHEGWQPSATAGPVLLSHGHDDPVVPFAASEEVQRRLEAAGAAVQMHPFSGGHSIDPALLPTIASFIRQQLGS